MKASEVKKVLVNHNVRELFHSNTVITSLIFINNGGLISRGTAEDCNLSQTSQISDEKDKLLGIYYDIFFDSVDIHKRAKEVNKYGPILFVYSVDLLDELEKYDICVTKDNPIRWETGMVNNERYYTDYEELDADFVKGDFAQHITIRNFKEVFSFDYLTEIIIDYPGSKYQKYFDKAYNTLLQALNNNNIEVPVVIRECSNECKCKEKYSNVGYTYYRFLTNKVT